MIFIAFKKIASAKNVKPYRLACTYVVLILTMLFSPWLHASETGAENSSLSNNNQSSFQLDILSEQTLQAMVSGQWKIATQYAERLVDLYPDYALGQLLLSEAHSVSGMSGTLLQNDINFSRELVGLLQEARSRLLQQSPVTIHNSVHDSVNIPAHTSAQSINKTHLQPTELIQIGKHIDHVVLVDLRASTLFLFDTKTTPPALVKQHYISSGEGGYGKTAEGDLKSPLGIYRIHGFRSDDSLPALYGSGALMLNYPNALDRALGRTGSGIWLHGNPRSNRSRSPLSSEGCVTMANDYLVALHRQLDLNRTHVVLSQSVNWQDHEKSTVRRERFQELFNQYQQAWVNSRVTDLTALYTPDALPSHVRLDEQAVSKKVGLRSNNGSRKIEPNGIELHALAKLDASDVSLLMNPSTRHTQATQHMVMSFELTGKHGATVTLYWELGDNGYWQIKREEIESEKA